MTEINHTGEKRPRVLIVDDTEDITNMLRLLLTEAGYDVVIAFSAPQALAAAQNEFFDLVISDIAMPAVSGYELAAQLRALPQYKRVPLIALTGFAEYDDKGDALASGFTEFIRKPVDTEAFLKIMACLQRSSNEAP
jgi:two-component system CheB/CheR fusion protein